MIPHAWFWALWIFFAGTALGVVAAVAWWLSEHGRRLWRTIRALASLADTITRLLQDQQGTGGIVRMIPPAGQQPEGLDPSGSGPMPVLRSDDKTGADR